AAAVGPGPGIGCPIQVPGTRHSFVSVIDKQAALVGRWLKCSAHGLVGPADTVGVEIASNGRYTLLVRDASGAIVAGKGVLYEGHLQVTLDQVHFVIDAGLDEIT